MSAPTLGELAVQHRYLSREALDAMLHVQRQAYLEGDYRRLGELLVDHNHCDRSAVRDLLALQGITIVECELCETRYNALGFSGSGACLRCKRRLRPSGRHAPLTVEDAFSGGGAQADQLLREVRQRNPRLGRYEILGEVGRGSMGVIYKAFQPDLQRYAALKFLLLHDPERRGEDLERFRLEARAITRVRHRNIVQAHAIEESRGLVYMAMDFVQGVNLERLAARKALDDERVVEVTIQIARALHEAHRQNLLHRDVKPQNIVIDRDGTPFLVDFGIAKDRQGTALTNEGEILGSLAYMAPEYVHQGPEALSPRCDVYGLGVVLYECLSGGKLPYGDLPSDQLIVRLVDHEPDGLEGHRPELDPRLVEIVHRAIAKAPERRHASALELAHALEAYQRGETLEPPTLGAAPAATEGGRGRGRGALVASLLVNVVLGGVGGWQWAQARAEAEGAERWRERAAQALLTAGEAFESTGDRERAEDAYRRAVEYAPGDPLAEQALERLRGR